MGVGLFLPACATTPQAKDDLAKRKMLEMLMPSRIEIVEPFTRVRSFDDDPTPDGIELLIRAVNALDNPGLMLAGTIRVELFDHVPASGNNKGARLDHWDIELTTAQHQKRFWNQSTQMYEFRLGLDRKRVPVAEKYVLVVSYTSPLDEQFRDEYVISASRATLQQGAGRS